MAKIKTILNRKKLTDIRKAIDNNDPSAADKIREIREKLEAFCDKMDRKRNKK